MVPTVGAAINFISVSSTPNAFTTAITAGAAFIGIAGATGKVLGYFAGGEEEMEYGFKEIHRAHTELATDSGLRAEVQSGETAVFDDGAVPKVDYVSLNSASASASATPGGQLSDMVEAMDSAERADLELLEAHTNVTSILGRKLFKIGPANCINLHFVKLLRRSPLRSASPQP